MTKIRPITITGDTARVPLTKGYTAIIDAADVELVESRNWCAVVSRRTVYAQTTVRTDIGELRSLRLHRQILGLTDPAVQADHVDLDGLNNRRYNLRPCSKAENMRNRGAQRNNKSGFKGVRWHTRDRRWVAKITVDGKQKHLGYFDTPDAAHAAYAAAAAEHHGEFARLA